MTSVSSEADPSGNGPPGLDLGRLTRYLRREGVIDAGTRLTADMITGGKSNLTYRLSVGDRTWVLRRPPLGPALPTAHDMRREHTVLRALAGSPIPLPRVLLLCTDDSVLGAPFYLMEHVHGAVLRDPAILEALGPDRVRALVMETVDVLVRLHAVDRAAVGLTRFGRPEGFARRQVERWRQQLDASRTRDIDGLDELYGRLAMTVPEDGDAAILHGDYRLDNLVVSENGTVRAVLDWEMATVGDPLADVALMLTYAERDVVCADGRSRPCTSVAGHPSVNEMIERYGSKSGRDLARLGWYRAFATFKLAVILEGVHARHLRGQTVGPGFEHVAGQVRPLVDKGLHLIGLEERYRVGTSGLHETARMATTPGEGATAGTGEGPAPEEARPARRPDGRMLRAERTRKAIIDAHNALMLEGDLQPTAVRVAERAGVSLRTLWSHFKDLEALFAAAGEKTLQIQYSDFREIDPDQPLQDRIDQFCRQRVRMLESIAGASRAAQIRLPFSAQLRTNRAKHNARLREEIERLFAREITDAGEKGPELVTTLLVISTWPAWMGGRDDLGLDVLAAAAVLRRAVTAVLMMRDQPPFHLEENG